jgi:putative peptide zinc metalloprotease protein
MRTNGTPSSSHRRRFARLTLATSLALVLIGGLPGSASAQGDSAAVAINTKDGSSIFRLAFSVRRVTGEVVDQANAAVAYASCEECRTVAVSIQLVLVLSDPDVVTPTNLALAVNQGCTSCETLASAYQYVLGVGGPVHFDAEGNQELASIKQALNDLVGESEGLELDQIQTEIDVLVDRLSGVVDQHLVAAGHDEDVDQGVEPGESPEPTPVEESPSPTPSPADSSASPSPASPSEPSPTPTGADPTPSPEESSTPSPEPT